MLTHTISIKIIPMIRRIITDLIIKMIIIMRRPVISMIIKITKFLTKMIIDLNLLWNQTIFQKIISTLM